MMDFRNREGMKFNFDIMLLDFIRFFFLLQNALMEISLFALIDMRARRMRERFVFCFLVLQSVRLRALLRLRYKMNASLRTRALGTR